MFLFEGIVEIQCNGEQARLAGAGSRLMVIPERPFRFARESFWLWSRFRRQRPLRRLLRDLEIEYALSRTIFLVLSTGRLPRLRVGGASTRSETR